MIRPIARILPIPEQQVPQLALLAMIGWVWLLQVALGLPPLGALVLAGLAFLLFGLMWAIAPAAERRAVAALYLAGLWACALQTLALRTFPQWQDAYFDSALYDRQARALVMHWQGLAVPTAEFHLKTLVQRGVPEWLPNDKWSYGQALGMSRYLYQLYLAAMYWLTEGSRLTAISGNMAFLATNVAGAFLLALSLFRQRAVAWLAAGLILLDSNPALWGSILMRDALISFLAMLAALGSVQLLRGDGRRWANGSLLVGALGLESLTRFNTVLALAMAGTVVGLAAWPGTWWRRSLIGLLGLAAAIVVLYQVVPGGSKGWKGNLFGHVVQENFQFIHQSRWVVQAMLGMAPKDEKRAKIDDVRRAWLTTLRERPWWETLGRATARSLMGPFPWVAFTHGISGTNFYELMYPGMTLWILCLPAFFYALWRVPVRGDPAVLLCLTWMGAVALIYIVGFGQLDGRNRMTIQPLLWVFTAQGMVWMKAKWTTRSSQNA